MVDQDVTDQTKIEQAISEGKMHTEEQGGDILTSTTPDWLVQTSDLITDGGPVVMILLGMSVVALAIVIFKLWQFYLLKLGKRETLNKALHAYCKGDVNQALGLLQNSPNPVMQAMQRSILGVHNKLPENQIREEVQRYGSDALFQLRHGFRPLEVIASLAPLLGLLGTVMGMITAFKQLEAAGSKVNPAVLSGGIWEALLTTAVGLAVAIPVVAVLNLLERRVDQLAHDMENYVTQIFTADVSAILNRQFVNNEVEQADVKAVHKEAKQQASDNNQQDISANDSAAIARV